jgi:hypothetical protein
MESVRMLWYTRGQYGWNDLRLAMMPYGCMVLAWQKERGLARLSTKLAAPPGTYISGTPDRDFPPLSLS